jgi:metal-responsive CopG/Arc/MetJ family transcriptional regulator
MGRTNVTLTIDEELLTEARVIAARQHTSVSGLIRDHLRLLVERDQHRHNAWEAVRRLVERPKARLGGPLPTREELHEHRA